MHDATSFRDAMISSARIAQDGRDGEALELVDSALAKALATGDGSWVRTLCHHAAIIARHAGNLDLAKRYYEQSLNSAPENSRALYGLAFMAREQGDSETAKRYAQRCYRALANSDEEPLRDEWMHLLLRNWPEVTQQ
jgi:tetratricopeptide (TPR) repeat protein